MAYTKLFNSIVTSTIWTEDDRTRIVWITMLAISDKNGEVQASVPGLARIAGVPVDACRDAITKFLSPDPDSRTKDDGGRRIEIIEGGWALLNFQKYREMASKEDCQATEASRKARYRAKMVRNGQDVSQMSRNVPPVSTVDPHIAEAEAEVHADADAQAKADAEADSEVQAQAGVRHAPGVRPSLIGGTPNVVPPSVPPFGEETATTPKSSPSVQPPIAKPPRTRSSAAAAPPGDERHARFLALWNEGFQAANGQTYAMGRADSAAISVLLGFGRTPDDLVALAERAWGNKMYGGWAGTILNFSKKYNELVVVLKAPVERRESTEIEQKFHIPSQKIGG